jgi:hypothetical protein
MKKMNLKALLFPLQSRDFPGLRALNITLRSLHLVGMAGMAGSYLYQEPVGALLPFWAVTLFSGVAMVLLAIWCDGRWLLQLRGAVVLFKLLLLWLLPWFASHFVHGGGWAVVGVIVLSSVISHAPARLRYRVVVHLSALRAL